MIVTQILPPLFSPITITIESQSEFIALCTALSDSLSSGFTEHTFDTQTFIRDLYESLRLLQSHL